MVILGIDPGLNATGYGIIQKKGNNLSLVDAGIIKTSSKKEISLRLFMI